MNRAGTFALVLVLTALAQPPPAARQGADVPRSPRNASYTISATLDPATHTIAGSGRLTWRNVSNAPAGELRFHMYWNAWRNTASTWMRERRLASPSSLSSRGEGDWGWIDLTRLARGGENLLAAARYIAPDDNNADDRTVLAVPLTSPVGPGETVEIDLAWRARVPRTFARTGRLGDYYFIAHWFPK
ncbi:MAG TPA: hypothetical protein VFO19_02180, partial [Vicinamibacterales bacterium]|nr:hypothetical protein [Vicinamibacterales bacterium]